MMSMAVAPMLVLLALSGGQNELLNYVPTDAYWQSKGITPTAQVLMDQLKTQQVADISALIRDLSSDTAKVRDEAKKKIMAMGRGVLPQVRPLTESSDAEVADSARQIVAELEKGSDSACAKLMAIRTLGETKCTAAVGALKGLVDSSEPFVAQYAREALARINGQAVPRVKADLKPFRGEVMLLPANCGLVGQLAVGPMGAAATLDSIMEDMGMGMPADAVQKAQVIDQMNKNLIALADQVGNIRIDGITLGVADDVGDNGGFVVVIARGLYDPQRIAKALEATSKPVRMDGMDTYTVGNGEANFVLASPQQLILVFGPSGKDTAPVVKQMAAAAKKGAGGLGENVEMVKLIKTVDTSASLWAAAKMSEAYRKDEFLAGFDTATLVGRLGEGSVKLEAVATGKDADKLEKSFSTFNQTLADIRKGIKMLQGSRAPAKTIQSVLDLMDAIKTKREEGKITVTVDLKGDPSKIGILPFLEIGPQAYYMQRATTRAAAQREKAMNQAKP